MTTDTATAQPEASPASVPPRDRSATARVLAKNTAWLAGGQVIGMPIAIVMNSLLARRLGPEDYGLLFLVTTLSGFAATFAECGQGGAAQRAVARDHGNAGTLLSSSIVLRLVSFAIAHVVLAGAVWILKYEASVALGIAIVAFQTFVTQFTGTAALAARAFERSDLVARNLLLLQIATLAFTAPVLLLGGGLLPVLLAQLVAALLVGWRDWRLLNVLGIELRRYSAATVRYLAGEGIGFLVLSGIIVLQWNINAVMLSKLTSAEVMGWYAASQRLVGFLIFPCTAVVGSLYPTLCRLLAESPEEARDTARSSLSVVSWVALPLAVGCASFPDIGVKIFSRESFGPAEDNLRISALVVFILCFVMVLATYLNALGKQRVWALLQLGGVVIGSGLNLLLVPWFQSKYGNGGLGVVSATVFSEGFLVVAGLALAPSGLLNAAFFRSFAGALVAAAAMGLTGFLLSPLLTSWGAAPVSLVVYAVGLRLTGVLNATSLGLLRDMLRRRKG